MGCWFPSFPMTPSKSSFFLSPLKTLVLDFPSGPVVGNLPANAGTADLIRSSRCVPCELGVPWCVACTGLPWWLSGKESACSSGDLQEIRVPSLGQEDHLEKEMATHSSILA